MKLNLIDIKLLIIKSHYKISAYNQRHDKNFALVDFYILQLCSCYFDDL